MPSLINQKLGLEQQGIPVAVGIQDAGVATTQAAEAAPPRNAGSQQTLLG